MLFRTSRGNIQYSTDAVQWYPHDTGIFLTLSADRVVRAWDTNEMEVEFHLLFGTARSHDLSKIYCWPISLTFLFFLIARIYALIREY